MPKVHQSFDILLPTSLRKLYFTYGFTIGDNEYQKKFRKHRLWLDKFLCNKIFIFEHLFLSFQILNLFKIGFVCYVEYFQTTSGQKLELFMKAWRLHVMHIFIEKNITFYWSTYTMYGVLVNFAHNWIAMGGPGLC